MIHQTSGSFCCVHYEDTSYLRLWNEENEIKWFVINITVDSSDHALREVRDEEKLGELENEWEAVESPTR